MTKGLQSAWSTRLPLTPLVAMLVLLVLAGTPVFAQTTYLDDIPWFAPADSTSRLAFVVEANRFLDDAFDWSVDRLQVAAILPAGERSIFFLRMSHLSFDTGSARPIERWPTVLGLEEQFQWDSETQISSFGQPEIGATGPLAIGGLTSLDYGVSLGLPVGADRLYPFASVSLPLRVALRRRVDLASSVQAGLTGSYLMNMDSGKDLLDESAFPDGWQLGLGLNWHRGRGTRINLAYDLRMLDGRKSEIVGAQAWFPWTAHGSVGLKIARDLSGVSHRPALWYLGLGWRFDSPGRRPGAEVEAEPTGPGAGS